jgi:predicted branched-subunit amino acid permease
MDGEEGRGGYAEGMRAGIPFVLSTAVLGISFGVLARSSGWGALAPVAFSALTFSSSAQFGVLAVLGAGGGVIPAVVAAALFNTRFLPMGVAVGPHLRGGRLRRALEGQAVVDASWALASQGGGSFDRGILMGATLMQYPAWVGGTLAGVLGGDVVGDPERLGLDTMSPAFFLVLLVGELRGDGRAFAVALLAAALAVSLVPFAPAGVAVIAACAVALLGLRREGGR